MKLACACCGYKTFNEPYGSFNICPVCYWEDDLIQLNNPTFEGGANGVSLVQAQKNFLAFGACEQEMKRHVRNPTKDELKEENWKPFQ